MSRISYAVPLEKFILSDIMGVFYLKVAFKIHPLNKRYVRHIIQYINKQPINA